MVDAKQPATAGINVVDVKVGQTIRLESVDFGEIHITINAKDGQRVRLGIKAGPAVAIRRPDRPTR